VIMKYKKKLAKLQSRIKDFEKMNNDKGQFHKPGSVKK